MAQDKYLEDISSDDLGSGSCGGGGLGGGGAILRRLAGGFKGRPRRRLAHHGSGRHHPGYDQLHLQLGPFHTKLAYFTSSPST
jgi:hypothetical protein